LQKEIAMRTHTQFKTSFAGVLIALAILAMMTSPAQVMGGGQPKTPAAIALPDAGLGSSLSFLPVVSYGSGGVFARSIAVADLNRDGKLDVVVANGDSNTVGVLLGNGDGTLRPAVTYPSGGLSPRSVAVADVNGDGKPDLVVANCGSGCSSGTEVAVVSVLLANGDGTFQPAVAYDSGGDVAESVVVGDVNADGKVDLLVANQCATTVNCGNGTVGVLLGNGDGTFQPAVAYDSGRITLSLAVGDVNADGKLDLLVVNFEHTVSVLLGNGDGTFQSALTYNSGGLNAVSVGVADVNGDSKLDLLVGNEYGIPCCHGGAVGVLLGNGDGTFQAAVAYDSGGLFAEGIAIVDINGDHKLDLVVANNCLDANACPSNGGALSVLLGNGDGTFHSAAPYRSGGIDAYSVAVGDLNEDGRPDLLVANCGSTVGCADGGVVGVLLNKPTTSTVLTSSLNPSIYGQKVTWTATVTSSGSVTPTGTIKFTWSGHTIGSATLNSSGVATLTRSNLNAATYPLTAVYPGDAANLGSTSAVLNQVVLQTTSKARLTSSPNPSTQGQAVTFTATITSPTVIPTGPVTFTAGTTVLGTAQLGGGKAKLVISSLPVGSTKVTVKYNGDSNIAKSSASVLQTVQ
jgi:hypothetical protein